VSATVCAVTPNAVIFDDLGPVQYHAMPHLSSTGLRRLLPPSTPSRYKWLETHPEPPTDAMQLGTAVHSLVLGVGATPAKAPARWQSTSDKDVVAEIRRLGFVPLRPDDFAKAHAMATAVRNHPLAAGLLSAGVAERVVTWTDPDTGIPCRAMIDWSPANGRSLVDLKTCNSAAPQHLGRHVAEHGYHVQDVHYDAGARMAELVDDDAPFVFIFVETTPPYGVAVTQLHPDDRDHARDLRRRALEIYRDCTESGIWPGYPTDLLTTRLPSYARRDPDFEEYYG
jgi:hypothetical protein